jgi:hypothetical protein
MSRTKRKRRRVMRSNFVKATLKTSILAVIFLLLGVSVALAQSVSLTAAATNTTLPDGTVVPMWGYSCGAVVAPATCAVLNTNAVATSPWSPVVITVPPGSLSISLTNSLPASVAETSLVIVGQLGGGLGTTATSAASPDHSTPQVTTWPIAGAGATNVPPPQGNRVRSFSTPATHTTAASLTWSNLKPGTYLIESGTYPSIQGPMGLYGILVVTDAPSATPTPPATATTGCAYPGATAATCAVPYNAEVPLLLSEIDPVQNNAVNTAVNTAGFSETAVWSGQPGGCGNPSSSTYNTCYPPAVNYKPLYYLINGVAFNKTSPGFSQFAANPGSAATGTVLVRLVNAGLRMHVPSIVGALTTPAVVPSGVTAAQVPGFSLVAEDGNPLPGVSRVQSEVFMAAGKTYDVMIDMPAACTPAPPATSCTTPDLPIFDRELSLSANAIARDGGMLAYIQANNGSGLPAGATQAVAVGAVANPDTYNSVVAGNTLTVSDPGKGVLANDVNVYGARVIGTAPAGLTLNPDGTFVYTAGSPTSFTYCGNGVTSGPACALVTLGAAPIEAGTGITCSSSSFSSNATTLSIKPPGILAGCKDAAGYPLTVNAASVTWAGFSALSVDPNGGFNASASALGGSFSFTFNAQNSQGTVSASTATVTVTFPAANGPVVKVVDGQDKTTQVADYRWIIEEDRTFYINPNCTTNPPPSGCPSFGSGLVPTFGTNFHTSYMPVIATGCTGPLSCESGQSIAGASVVCDVGNGICRPGSQQTALDPAAVHLDPTKHYYISVLPGDAANSFENANSCLSNPTPSCGHGMGGAPIACVPATGSVTCTATSGSFPASVTVLVQPNPFPPSKLSVFVFQDDFPLNGEQDGGGGVDVLSPHEPGLGSFNITLFDDAGGTGDATGQMTYDMFNMPLSNGLSGTIDPSTGLDACPVSANATTGFDGQTKNATGITGTIVTCPKYEADGKTLSPIAGHAIVSNLMPGRYGVVATPGADRIARGEEWLQTNTLDGQKAHDSFLRIGEPSFFQEFGPAGYHVSIGFANPVIINSRLNGVCNGSDPTITGNNCTNVVTGTVTTERMSRTPDERLYSSGDNTSFAFTQCYVSFGDPDGEDFAFTKCDANGQFTLSGLPDGDWRITVFDQWNDMLVDGLSTPVRLGGGATVNLGQIATNQWQANIYTRTFFDKDGNGVANHDLTGVPCTAPGTPANCNPNYGNDLEAGLTLVPTNIRFRDGSYSNFNNTDLNGYAGFNEVFPLFSWYVIETESTRFKTTGVHVVYDAGGPSDGSTCGGTTGTVCGDSNIAGMLANTAEQIPLPTNLRVPGAYYCATADCLSAPAPLAPGGPGGSTGRVDPPYWFGTEGWQGFSGQNSFVEFGKKPYAAGETGGIFGEVIYASTRPFDDPTLLIHTSWTPDVPGVTVNLYQEGTAPDGTTSLKLVDTTKTSSWDDWAQGVRSDGMPNMNCPGQGTASGTNADLFFFSLYNQPQWLDLYNVGGVNGGNPGHPLPNNSQFKCYDGMHNWNQVQPAPYDGMYQFPSVTSLNPTTGKPAGTNCHMSTTAEPWGCVPNPDTTDTYRVGTPMLRAGKYVVEMVVPPGYELVKEEDKNILIGDNYIAPVTQEFAGLGNVFILPDQAEVAAYYNANNPQNPTTTFGRTTLPSQEGDTGSVETFWPCVGASRVVPDYISLFPQSKEVAPFAGATRNLCDRKEVTLTDQAAALAKFWIFTSAHVAAHFTGVITDDYTSEFDPFSPQFGEKFSPPDLPISIKDWSGAEIARTYADHWGAYNGLTYSTWEVNPPNPTGYAPTMMVVCMNDPGTGPAPDPLYNPEYSNFCYEIPFMPGQTQYMDTPVVPTSAFAGAGYNNPDCAYPDLTPAVSEVDGDGVGPWVSQAGVTLTITSLGSQPVPNNAYSGPSATTAPYNQKFVARNYGFGSQCLSPTAGSTTCNTLSSVTIGGRSAIIDSWSDTQIQVTVPTGVPNCAIQQQAQYAGSTAQCGQLVITAGNGKQSVDTVTVTIGGKAPTHVNASGTIQSAIDAAAPGDLIIVDPTCATSAAPTSPVACTSTTAVHSQSAHQEILLMWKPVRLQGVGAASSIINANPHPAGKLDTWRKEVNCLFGLGLNGSPTTWTPGCAGAGWFGFNATANNPQIDRLPLEATVGWDASLNGNLAELLQEPSLMGALEGAGITVLSKGVDFHGASPWDPTLLGGFPAGTTLLTSANCGPAAGPNPFPSSFQCNPSSIDGLGITNSSQGGGGVFVHGWGHNLQIANNRVYSNAGTLSGGISVGQGEFPTPYLAGSATNAPPGSCQSSSVTNLQLPYCHNLNVNLHNNAITSNSSTGDELFSATPAGGGGVSVCTGADYYQFNYNWVCGNLSTGDGGGVAHIGFSYNGDIEHNAFLFNQSSNPTIVSNGGGLLIMGAPDADPGCGVQVDTDCVPAPGSIGPSDGTGPNLVINANLIMGNQAESGSGGGLALQQTNGSDVVSFPTTPANWNNVTVTNNIITNNVAGWDGAGISLLDALNVNIINNTIMSNDSTASSGVLFNTVGAPLASAPDPHANCIQGGTTSSCPQPAGLVSIQNSAVLQANLPATITCPLGHFQGTTASNGSCRQVSYPELWNDVFWQNRSFYISVGALGTGTLNQQNVVTLRNAFTTTTAPSQSTTGACPAASYWDIGVRGDLSPTTHESTITLTPEASILTDITGYPGGGTGFQVNSASNPVVVSQYCNGSRVPPEFGGLGWQVPPGIADATVPNPIFNLMPAATVDEGNNWINISWGPLAMANPVTGTVLGNYALTGNSPAINYITPALSATTYAAAPSLDFFGNSRKTNNAVDVGAVEFQGSGVATIASISPTSGAQGTVVPVTITGSGLLLASAVNVSGTGITVGPLTTTVTTITTTFTIASNATLSARNVTVTTPTGNSNAVTFTVVAPPVPTLTSVAPATEIRGTSVPVVLTGTNFVTGATVVASPAATGFTISGVLVVSPTTIDATFTSTTAAAIGNVNIEVVTAGGASNTLPFAITGPVLTSISPVSANRGTASVPVTLTGSGLTGTTTVNVSGNGFTVTNVTVVNDSTVTATFAIAPFATPGARNVTVTAPGGNSNAVTFTVTVPPAGLFSIMPNTGARGTTQAVTLTGISLTGATAVNVSGGGITVTFTVTNDTTINANFIIPPAAALTARNVTVTAPSGTTTPVTFTVVNPGTPILSSITPASGFRRTVAAANPVAVVLAGSNFTAGSTVNVVAPANGLTVTGVTLVSPTQINATFNTTSTATIGPRSITVTTPGGTSGPATYTVLGPVLTSIDPTSALRGQGAAVPVSIFGRGLTGTTAVTPSGGGITVGPITVVSDTQVTTTFTIAAGAAGTARTVTVTAPGGVSNSVAFTVTIPPTPTLTSVAPPTGVRATTVPVTLTGTNFIVGKTTVAVAGGGVTVSGVTVTSPTTLTAIFTISSTAAIGAHNVTVSVAGAAAASNTVPFTVQGATLTSISPNAATHPATGTLAVPVTIIGTNLTGATGLTGLGSGVTAAAGTFTVVNSSAITVTLNVSSTATIGFRNIGVTTPIGATNTLPFTVN